VNKTAFSSPLKNSGQKNSSLGKTMIGIDDLNVKEKNVLTNENQVLKQKENDYNYKVKNTKLDT
jgi:hypothetical protein